LFKLPDSENIQLPGMQRVKQVFNVPPPMELEDRLQSQWAELNLNKKRISGARIAVCVGSRGIAQIADITRGIVKRLVSCGARPFIVPAMGSHGNGTAQGQMEILARLGIDEQKTGAPVHGDMDVECLGDADGIPLYLSRAAMEADGIVLINRVKPHTDFTGPIESGTLKMLVIGLGNQKGAEFYHRMAVHRGFYEMIITAGRALLEKTNVLFGVQVVENQPHQVCDLRITPPEKLEKTEEQLLNLARTCLPGLPLDEIDLLIVDQMGKNFSGAGLDPNVLGFSSCKWGKRLSSPKISRVFVRGLSKESKGNASGIGMVDVATAGLVDQVDWQATGLNGFTACCPEDCKVPLTVETEKEAVTMCLGAIRPYTREDLRVVHIKNTLELDELLLSRGCFDILNAPVEKISGPTKMTFNKAGEIEYT